MKKKNVLMMALSLCLVAVVAIGGTLAYLTATPDQVTNTFAFVTAYTDGSGAINVKVEEQLPSKDSLKDADATYTYDDSSNVTGIAYTDVVPNQILDKTPVVSTKNKVESWVFVRITEGNVSIQDMSDKWVKISDASLDDGVSVYAYEEPVAATEGENFTVLDTLFTKVKVVNDSSVQLDSIVIEVGAVQTGIDLPEEAEKETAQIAYDAVKDDGLF